MKNLSIILSIAISSLVYSCGTPTTDTASTTESTQATAGQLADGNYTVSANSTLGWAGAKASYGHVGTIGVSSAKFSLSGGNLSSGEITVDMNTIQDDDLSSDTVNRAKLVGHLKSDDFFSVSSFPTASFKLTSATKLAQPENGNTHTLVGKLTIKGIENEITFPAKLVAEGTSAKLSGEFGFDRSKWQVKFGSAQFPDFVNWAADKIIKDEIKIKFDLTASPEAI